jgi:hypothetical protein
VASDRATDDLLPVFNTPEGRRELIERRGVPAPIAAALSSFGLSSICSVLAAVKLARQMKLGPDQAIFTVATDGAASYGSELERIMARCYPDGFDEREAGESFTRHLLAASRPRARADTA